MYLLKLYFFQLQIISRKNTASNILANASLWLSHAANVYLKIDFSSNHSDKKWV